MFLEKIDLTRVKMILINFFNIRQINLEHSIIENNFVTPMAKLDQLLNGNQCEDNSLFDDYLE